MRQVAHLKHLLTMLLALSGHFLKSISSKLEVTGPAQLLTSHFFHRLSWVYFPFQFKDFLERESRINTFKIVFPITDLPLMLTFAA